MIVLDSVQLLDAVHRSLSSNVLPMLEDDFARVQIAAALKILEEVGDRLENGDPCEDFNAAISADVTDLAGRVQKDEPDFAQALEAAVASALDGGEPRDVNRQLVESLWSAATKTDAKHRTELLSLLNERAKEISANDARWICPEALLSLI
ncbi:MAG: hypothetical protein CMQ20_02770 [Gammaproteobacteria bacterium]|jgi:hypothetical protein|nr:hypothetical protein [Gammaproteobacteria bacterium]|tara:strand:+ start:30 stop:482 length:453 start_codon:yes stop_codon:yes gene_type:complete